MEGEGSFIPPAWVHGASHLVPDRKGVDWRTLGLSYLERPDGLQSLVNSIYSSFPLKEPPFRPADVPSYLNDTQVFKGLGLEQVARGSFNSLSILIQSESE